MIGFYGVKGSKNCFVIDFEDEDIPFMSNIISIISERNALLKELKTEEEE